MRGGCPICGTVGAIRGGDFPLLLAELSETFAVLGENQGCPGWTVLLLKDHADHLGELAPERQRRVWDDVMAAAAALRDEFPRAGAGGGPVRINYECLGNLVPHVHWHVIPRHADDPEPARPVWGWTPEKLRGAADEAQRRELASRLRRRIMAGGPVR
jgi:diadenosine tetraphosphate (Ap4A) HIT family hydrolase